MTQELAQARPVKTLEDRHTQSIRRARPSGDRIIHKRPREHTRQL